MKSCIMRRSLYDSFIHYFLPVSRRTEHYVNHSTRETSSQHLFLHRTR
jgi:hypothetical protein